MNPLLARLKKASKIAETSTLAENEILGNIECAPTHIPCIDIAFCGALDGGVTSGLTCIAGASKCFKCVDGETRIILYVDSNHKIETTYAEMFDLCTVGDKTYYVKDHKGNFTPIRAVGKKRSDTWMVDFDNGYQIRASGRHAFMGMDGEPLFTEDLKPNDKVKTIDGYLTVKARHSYIEEQDVYDINIDAPHWYVNDDVGLIHHNTMIALVCAKAYLDKYDDAVMIFYDSEMGASKEYFNSLGIDQDRVLYTPITDVEELKFDLMSQLEQIKRGDHVIIVIDSVGNLASKKEVEDALNEKSAADMTRAKQLKSLTRMITPHLNLKNIPLIMINHVYQEIALYPKAIVSGGCVEKGTKVRMADETLKNIEDIHVGDMVKTLDGDHSVTATWNPKTLANGTPTCYRVTFEDGSEVVCSDIHRFRKGGEWEFVTSLNVGDELDELK